MYSSDRTFGSLRNYQESRLIPAQVDLSHDYDADTFRVRVSLQHQGYLQGKDSVRLLGIDAPETSHFDNKGNQYYGQESKRILKDLLPSDGRIYLRLPGTTSKTRIMGEAFFKDTQGNLVSLNQELVRREAAYLYDSRDFRDPSISTPELEKKYYSKVEQYINSPAKEGLFSSQALYPEDFRAIQRGRMSGFLPPKALDRLKVNLQNYKFRVLSKTLSEEYGITNQQLAPFFNPESESKFIIPSQYGSSYFYQRAIYAATRQQAGLFTFDVTDTVGPATSAYKLTYMAQNAGKVTDNVPEYIKNYDREMATPGGSYYINKWAITNGWGRIYKEENGPLGSLAGALGKVLDNSLVYYGGNLPDYIRRQQEIDPTGNYIEPPAGFFESTLGFITNFGIQTSQAVLTYFLIGVPFGILSAEMFKASYQSLLDFSLSSTIKNKQTNFVTNTLRNISTGLTVGWEYAGRDGEVVKRYLWQNQKNLKDELYKPGFNSFISGVNLFQNQKAAIFFDYTVRPFIEDVINPYKPDTQNFKLLQSALTNFRNVATSNIFGQFDSNDRKTAKFILQNDGFEKHKKIAEALDELGGYLPFNPSKWGWMGKQYDKVSLIAESGRTVAKNFLAMNEVFNFTELLHTLERLYYGGEFLTIVNRGTYINEADGALGNIIAKGQSSFAVPKTLFGKAAQIVGVGVARIFNLDGLNSILSEHKKLRKLEIELNNKALSWDGDFQNRLLESDNPNDIRRFLQGILNYETALQSNKQMGITRDAMVEDASRFYNEQKYAQAHIRNPHKLITNNDFINNRNKVGVYIAAILGAHFALDDLMKNTTGASLWSQLAVAFNHRETGVTPDFAATRVFGWGGGPGAMLASVGWTGFSLAVGYGVATYVSLKSPNIDRYIIGSLAKPEVDTFVGKLNATQKRIMSNVIKGNSLNTVRPKGNFLLAMSLTTTGLLIARAVAPFVVSSAARIVQSIPFVGEMLLGKGNTKLNENIGVVSELALFRKELIDKMRSGKPLSNLQALAGYELGFMMASQPIVNSKIKPKDTRVVANQAPTPYFQMFMTETTKGRQYDEMGQLVKQGSLEFKAGLQTAPIMGTNISFLLPVSIDLDKKNHLGFNGALVYNNGKDNILNYLNAIGAAGANLAVFTTSMLATLDLMNSIANFPGIKNIFNANNVLSDEIKATSNLVKSTFKTFYGMFEGLVALPVSAANMPRGMGAFYGSVIEAAGLTVKSSHDSLIIPQSKSGKLVKPKHTLNRLAKSFGLATLLFAPLTGTVAKMLGADEVTQWLTMGTSIIGGTTALYASSYMGIDIPAKLGNISSKVTKSFTLAEKIPILSKRTSSFYLMLGATMAWGWLQSDSTFGISNGMDKKYTQVESDGILESRSSTDWIKKGITVAGYTASILPALLVSDIGKSPSQILDEYIKNKDYLAKVSNYNNPLDYIRSKYTTYKTWVQKGYIDVYLARTLDYIADPSLGVKANNILPEELSNAMIAQDQIDNVRTKLSNLKLDVLDNQLVDEDLRKGLSALWKKQNYLQMKNSFGTTNLRTKKLVAFSLITAFTGMIAVPSIMAGWGYVASGGGTGQKSIDAFYTSLDGSTLGEGLANVFRLVTKHDKRHSSNLIDNVLIIDEKTGRETKQLGYRLINPLDTQQQKITKTLQDIMAPFIVDPQNTFQSILPGIGITLSSSDRGVKYRIYAQQQSALQDTSFAIYSTLPSYFFKLGLTPNTQYNLLIEEGLKKAKRDNSKLMSEESYDNARALATLGAAYQLSPLTKSRKYSIPYNDSTLELVSGNSLLSRSLQLRIRRANELAYQDYKAIAANMFDLRRGTSILTNLSNVVDIRNPLAALRDPLSGNSDISTQMLQNQDTKGIARLIRAIFATNNRLEINKYEITKTESKELSLSSKAIQNPGTELALGGSLQLDTLNMESDPWWGILGKGVESGVRMTEGLPTPVRLGIGAAVVGGGLFMTLGFMGSLMYSPQELRFEEATARFKNMFAVDTNNSVHNFHAQRRIVVDGKIGIQIKGNGGKQFGVFLPEGLDKIGIKDVDEVLQHVQITIGQEHTRVVKEVFDITDDLIYNTTEASQIGRPDLEGKFKGAGSITRERFIGDLKISIDPIIDSYVDNVFSAFLYEHSSGLSFSDLTTKLQGYKAIGPASPIDNKIKQQIKQELYRIIDNTLAEEIHKSAVMGEDFLAKVKGAHGKKIADLLGHKLRATLDNFADRLNNNLLYLESEDALGYGARLNNLINEMAEPFGGWVSGTKNWFNRNKQLNTPRTSNPQLPKVQGGASEELLDYVDNLQSPKLSKRTIAGIGFNKSLEFIGLAATVFEGLDVYTAYNRLAAYESDSYRTEGEIKFAAESAGQVTVNSGISILASVTFLKKLPDLAKYLGKGMLKNPGKGTIIIGIGSIIAASIWAGFKSISQAWDQFSKTNVMKTITGGIGTTYEVISRGIGTTILEADRLFAKLPVVQPGTLISAVGLGLTFALLAFGASVSVPAIIGYGLLGALSGGIIGSIPGLSKFTNGILTPFMDWMSNIPVIGGILATNSQQPIAFTKFYDNEAPIYVATAQQAIAYDSSKYLEASADWSGQRTKGLFDNPTFYGNSYKALEPGAKRISKPTFSLVNSMLDKEANIRAQYYNQAVVGNASWNKMIFTANNYKELKAYTIQLSKGDPLATQKLKAAEEQRQKDLKDLQKNSSSKLNNKQSSITLTATIVSIAKSSTNVVERANSNIKKTVEVEANAIQNPYLDNQVNLLIAQKHIQPVIIKSVKAEQVNNKVVINSKVSDKNNLQLAVTRGLVNNYNIMPGYN